MPRATFPIPHGEATMEVSTATIATSEAPRIKATRSQFPERTHQFMILILSHQKCARRLIAGFHPTDRRRGLSTPATQQRKNRHNETSLSQNTVTLATFMARTEPVTGAEVKASQSKSS